MPDGQGGLEMEERHYQQLNPRLGPGTYESGPTPLGRDAPVANLETHAKRGLAEPTPAAIADGDN
eukprot:scaffold70897_cov16-Prasinocladus_malaysianus.AAC.1